MNSLVIYKSNYGATKQYAEWIAGDLSCDIKELSKTTSDDLDKYDTVIIGGGVYAGGINGSKFIENNAEILKDKNVVLFICCISDPDNEKNLAKLKSDTKEHIPPEVLKNAKVYYVRGMMDVNNMSFIHKSMMKMLKNMLTKKEDKTEEDKELLANFDKKVDFVDKKYIEKLIEDVKSL